MSSLQSNRESRPRRSLRSQTNAIVSGGQIREDAGVEKIGGGLAAATDCDERTEVSEVGGNTDRERRIGLDAVAPAAHRGPGDAHVVGFTPQRHDAEYGEGGI